MIRPIAPLAALPTPEQIAETPELVALHALEHVLELTFRTLVAIHPDLENTEAPYWVLDPSRARRAAHQLVMAASQLEGQINEYLVAVDLDRQTEVAGPEDDLPF